MKDKDRKKLKTILNTAAVIQEWEQKWKKADAYFKQAEINAKILEKRLDEALKNKKA